MAPLPKPADLLRWGTDETNDTEPLEAKKDSGYTVDEEPSSAETNWLLRIAGETQEWLRQRLFDGGSSSDFEIRAPDKDAAGSGGETVVEGGAGFGAGDDGGDAFFRGGDPGGTGASAGSVTLGGQVSDGGIGSTTSAKGGQAEGTDQDGGELILSAGRSTGSGSGDVVIEGVSGGSSGTTLRNPAEFLRADGSALELTIGSSTVTAHVIGLGQYDDLQSFENTAFPTVRGPLRVTPALSGAPATNLEFPQMSTAGDGELYSHSGLDQLFYLMPIGGDTVLDRAYQSLSPVVYRLANQSADNMNPGAATEVICEKNATDIIHTVTAAYIGEGAMFRVRAYVENFDGAGNMTFRLYAQVGLTLGTPVASFTVATGEKGVFDFMFNWVTSSVMEFNGTTIANTTPGVVSGQATESTASDINFFVTVEHDTAGVVRSLCKQFIVEQVLGRAS